MRVGEVAGVDLAGVEVFEGVEAGEFGGDLGGGEEELEGLSGELDAGGEGVVGELLEEGKGCAGLAVVEDDAAAGGALGDEVDGGAEGGEGEVGDDSEPGEEGGSGGVEAGEVELGGEGFALKVDWHEGQGGGDGDGVLGEEVALPLLGGGVVDLEDAEVGVGVAVGEGVEAGSEEDVLGDSVGDGCCELVLGVAAAGDDEGAEGGGEGLVELGGGLVEVGGVLGAEDGDGDGVFEDVGRGIVDLMGRSAESYAEGGAGWAGFLHAVCFTG